MPGPDSAGQIRDTRHSEYGGGPGAPERREDGSAKELTVAERARMVRLAGMVQQADGGVDLRLPDGDGPEFDAAKREREINKFWGLEGGDTMTPGEAREAERRRLKAQSNSYSDDPLTQTTRLDS